MDTYLLNSMHVLKRLGREMWIITEYGKEYHEASRNLHNSSAADTCQCEQTSIFTV